MIVHSAEIREINREAVRAGLPLLGSVATAFTQRAVHGRGETLLDLQIFLGRVQELGCRCHYHYGQTGASSSISLLGSFWQN
jgi:hypothetical protein